MPDGDGDEEEGWWINLWFERRLLWCINLFQIAISHTLSFQQFKFKSKHREWKCAEENVDFRPFLYLACWQFWWYVAEESMWYKIWIKWSPACNLLPLTHMVVLICKLEVFTNFSKSGIWVVFLRIWLYKSRVEEVSTLKTVVWTSWTVFADLNEIWPISGVKVKRKLVV